MFLATSYMMLTLTSSLCLLQSALHALLTMDLGGCKACSNVSVHFWEYRLLQSVAKAGVLMQGALHAALTAVFLWQGLM